MIKTVIYSSTTDSGNKTVFSTSPILGNGFLRVDLVNTLGSPVHPVGVVDIAELRAALDGLEAA